MRLAAAVSLAAVVSAQSAVTTAPHAVETFDAAWSTINDTYYDPAFRGVDWEAVRSELRPRAAAAPTTGALRAVLAEMLGRLGESHFAVLPHSVEMSDDVPGDQSGSTGFDVRAHDGKLYVTRVDADTPAASAALHAGDRILEIENEPVADLFARVAPTLEPRLRAVELWRAATLRLRGPVGSVLTLRVAPGSGSPARHLRVVRIDEPGETVRLGNLPPLKLDVRSAAAATPSGAVAGVIRFNVWMAGADAPLADAIDRHRDARGIVIDLRGNPGGLAGMIMGVSGHFFGERVALGTMTSRANALTFYANPRLSRPDGSRVQPYAGPVAILIDGMTGSASECFAGGMQAVGRARVFGQRSMGQALPASFATLPNGDTLLYAIADFVTADGTRLEGRGVVPDAAVPFVAEALAAGHDPALQAALAWIDTAEPKY